MNLHDSGINHGVFHVRLLRQGIENPLENIGFAPIAKPPECSTPVAEHGWQIAPRTARPDDPKNRPKKQPVIPAAPSGVRRLAQTMRFHLRPLGVGKYKAIHPMCESHLRQNRNPKSPQPQVHFQTIPGHPDGVFADGGLQTLDDGLRVAGSGQVGDLIRPCRVGWR